MASDFQAASSPTIGHIDLFQRVAIQQRGYSDPLGKSAEVIELHNWEATLHRTATGLTNQGTASPSFTITVVS